MSDKIRVLIVDDEPLARRGICQLLETETDFVVAGDAANGREAAAAIEKLAPDLVFLDIQMPLLDGFAFLEKVGAENLPEIVFVTAYDDHAIRAFEAGAIDYVLKPINPERFQKTLERVRRRIISHENKLLENKIAGLLNNLKFAGEEYLQRIAVKEHGRIRLLDVENIDRISSLGNYIEIHSGREKFVLRETMNGIESKLDPQKFLRIRRSIILRIAHIKELQPLFNGEYTVILSDGTETVSSRRYRKNLEAILKF
ncbi:MAG TPA: response regulator [Pyrinomonadaceae bacterium]|jgi:two-component system LytT family response regulator|nr:response regulator [Pyrinomonadaceae bacterium]